MLFSLRSWLFVILQFLTSVVEFYMKALNLFSHHHAGTFVHHVCLLSAQPWYLIPYDIKDHFSVVVMKGILCIYRKKQEYL